MIIDALPKEARAGRSGIVHRSVMADFPDFSGPQIFDRGAPVVVDSCQRDFTMACVWPEDQFFADANTSERDKFQTTP